MEFHLKNYYIVNEYTLFEQLKQNRDQRTEETNDLRKYYFTV